MKLFNYRDWLSWGSLIIIIYVVLEFIIYIDNWKEWKWGYYNIDLIPAMVILVTLFLFLLLINIDRLNERLYKLEIRK